MHELLHTVGPPQLCDRRGVTPPGELLVGATAELEGHVPPGGVESPAEIEVALAAPRGIQRLVVAAPVHLDVLHSQARHVTLKAGAGWQVGARVAYVNTPASEEVCILLVVPEGPWAPAVVAGERADGGVPAPAAQQHHTRAAARSC
jgi:hypothetical protein